jgi:hypothetical protein
MFISYCLNVVCAFQLNSAPPSGLNIQRSLYVCLVDLHDLPTVVTEDYPVMQCYGGNLICLE